MRLGIPVIYLKMIWGPESPQSKNPVCRQPAATGRGKSVRCHRRKIVLPSKSKGQTTVLDQRQTLTIRAVYRIQRVTPTNLRLNILRKVLSTDRPHVNRVAFVHQLGKIIFNMHFLTPS